MRGGREVDGPAAGDSGGAEAVGASGTTKVLVTRGRGEKWARTSRDQPRASPFSLLGGAIVLLLLVERSRLCFNAPSCGSFGLLEQCQLGRRGGVISRRLDKQGGRLREGWRRRWGCSNETGGGGSKGRRNDRGWGRDGRGSSRGSRESRGGTTMGGSVGGRDRGKGKTNRLSSTGSSDDGGSAGDSTKPRGQGIRVSHRIRREREEGLDLVVQLGICLLETNLGRKKGVRRGGEEK